MMKTLHMEKSDATETEHIPASIPGRFAAYGGRYVPETLMAALEELEHAYADAQQDPAFASELSICCIIMQAGRRRSISPNA